MFLTSDELISIVDHNLVSKLTADNSSIVNTIITESIETMRSYLSKYYDADAIFDKEDTARNINVLKKLKDIVVYEIYTRNPRAMNAVAEKKYNEAINWLEKLNEGKFTDKTLPVPAPEVPSVQTSMRLGSNQKYQSNF